MLIFFSVQLSLLAARQVEIAQSLALRELQDRESADSRESKGKGLENLDL
jgi:hypothetical protein